jgi:hypothetical protein
MADIEPSGDIVSPFITDTKPSVRKTPSLGSLFSKVEGSGLDKFTNTLETDNFDPMPTVIFVDGHEIRMSYTPSDMTKDGKGELKIPGIQNVPIETLRIIKRFYSKPDINIKLARFDGRNNYEDLED